MKNIKSLFLIVLMGIFATSCDDAVDIIQDGELDDEASFQNVNDLNSYLVGAVYSSIGATNEIGLTASFTDEVSIGVNNGGQEVQLHRFFLNQSTGYVSGIWTSHYTVINRVNRLLRAAEGIVPSEEPDVNGITEVQKYNSILAQARAVRAYSYLQLMSFFSEDMTNDAALGVILLDFVPVIDEKLPRVANSEIYALMEADLEYADANIGNVSQIFSDGPQASQAYFYASENLISAIRARMYLYRKNYTLAQQYAQETITNSGLVLTPAGAETAASPYVRMWADLAQGEILFALARPSGGAWGNIASLFYFNTTDATGGAFLEMSRDLYNKLQAQRTWDIRRYAFVDATATPVDDYNTRPDYIAKDVLPINKYPGKTGQALRNDLKIFRLSEMYFILAESAVSQGELTTAAGYIKNIRDARSKTGPRPLPAFVDATAAWAGIMDERRLELCYEGFRYLDVKRLGVLANKSLERDPTDDPIKTLPTTLSNTDYRFVTLPIPQSEIAGNPTIQQNPGYN